MAIKSVYDPSPPGYMVTISGLWTIAQNKYANNANKEKIIFDRTADNTEGIHLFCNFNYNKDETFYIPAFGEIDLSYPYGMSTSAKYWNCSASTSITTKPAHMFEPAGTQRLYGTDKQSTVHLLANRSEEYGFAVMCMRDTHPDNIPNIP